MANTKKTFKQFLNENQNFWEDVGLSLYEDSDQDFVTYKYLKEEINNYITTAYTNYVMNITSGNLDITLPTITTFCDDNLYQINGIDFILEIGNTTLNYQQYFLPLMTVQNQYEYYFGITALPLFAGEENLFNLYVVDKESGEITTGSLDFCNYNGKLIYTTTRNSAYIRRFGANGLMYYAIDNSAQDINFDDYYYLKTEIDEKLDDYVSSEDLTTTLANYVTSESLETTLGEYVTNETLTSTLDNYVLSTRLTNNYYTKSEVDDKINEVGTATNLTIYGDSTLENGAFTVSGSLLNNTATITLNPQSYISPTRLRAGLYEVRFNQGTNLGTISLSRQNNEEYYLQIWTSDTWSNTARIYFNYSYERIAYDVYDTSGSINTNITSETSTYIITLYLILDYGYYIWG